MHEYSIVQALVTQVEQQARKHKASAVHSLELRIGELSGVEVGLLKTAYDLFRAKTVCENAELRVVSVKACWACRACGAEIATGGPLRCPACGEAARLVSGDEILLERLELEVA